MITVAGDVGASAVTTTATSGVVDLLDASFVFQDPPEAGAHAQFRLNIRVRETASANVALDVPLDWLDGFEIARASPQPTSNSTGRLVFVLQPGVNAVLLDVIARGDRVDAPTIHVQFADSGAAIGDAHPTTVAPKPRPGPVSAIRIPRLGLNVAVVPTSWEPPAFLVGQLRTSANVTLGNTVLVGHLGGAAGDVFKNLDQLQPGDSIVALSRGVEYAFVVSDKQTLPADDAQPTAPEPSPRLTLMTCTGTWDPVARNYSDRLWVTAEPRDPALLTIASNAARPPTPVPTETPRLAGLGADRSVLDAELGHPLGETPGKLVVYRKGSVEYHVAYTPDPARARLIELLPVTTGAGISLQTAVQRTHSLFPPDATPRSEVPDGTPSLVLERLSSPGLGAQLKDTLPPDSGADSSAFLAAYARLASGEITRVVVGAGDDVATLMSTADR